MSTNSEDGRVMRVRMLVGLSGPTVCLSPGDEHEFPIAEARRLIAAEYAVPAVVEEQQRELAIAEPPAIERRGNRAQRRARARADSES